MSCYPAAGCSAWCCWRWDRFASWPMPAVPSGCRSVAGPSLHGRDGGCVGASGLERRGRRSLRGLERAGGATAPGPSAGGSDLRRCDRVLSQRLHGSAPELAAVGCSPSARGLVPVLFLLSSLSCGAAVVFVVASLVDSRVPFGSALRRLRHMDRVIILAEAVAAGLRRSFC